MRKHKVKIDSETVRQRHRVNRLGPLNPVLYPLVLGGVVDNKTVSG